MPLFLRYRPVWIAKHVLKRHQDASTNRPEKITEQGDGAFRMQSQTTPQDHHLVQFGFTTTMPSCSCDDWRRNMLPCKHFSAVFRVVEGWGWERLDSMYLVNPLFSLDEKYVSSPRLPPGDVTPSSLVEPTCPPSDVTYFCEFVPFL